MRQIFLDTETTGLSAATHRVIEIGCIEYVDRTATGRVFHHYLNPERDVDAGAERVHGLSRKFLQDKPKFHTLAQELFAFLDGAELIIHNAPFDTGFLSAEFQRCGFNLNVATDFTVIDTLAMARQRYPGQKNGLDALCKRLGVNNAHRVLHGALLDAQILAEVYAAMTGGQTLMSFDGISGSRATGSAQEKAQQALDAKKTARLDVLVIPATQEEIDAHENYWK
ncbi:MAG: DNA polymerase III subunit epsilon [Pseudomonadota bacterium]